MNITSIKSYISDLKIRMQENPREKRRIIILAFASLFLLDYLMYSYHTDKNIFNIVPSLPFLEDNVDVTLYLPDHNGKNLMKENRSIPDFQNNIRLARYLFFSIVKGSRFENTAYMVPAKIFMRNIWIYKDKGNITRCVFDIEPIILGKREVIPGSEELFKKALEKTVVTAIPSIKSVEILERGIPGRNLWEL